MFGKGYVVLNKEEEKGVLQVGALVMASASSYAGTADHADNQSGVLRSRVVRDRERM